MFTEIKCEFSKFALISQRVNGIVILQSVNGNNINNNNNNKNNSKTFRLSLLCFLIRQFLIIVLGNRENVQHCGTTATVALLRDGTDLTVASVGDSSALICRLGDAVSLTNAHHPTREDELQRITSLNGWIDWGFDAMVNGKLAMTRSIGDFHLKPYGVIATPEITQLKLNHQTDSFIVLHTDGISHVMSDKEVTELVRNCPDAEYAANVLTSCALQYGSEDNITAIVIPLRLWGKYRTQQISKELSLLKNMRIKYN